MSNQHEGRLLDPKQNPAMRLPITPVVRTLITANASPYSAIELKETSQEFPEGLTIPPPVRIGKKDSIPISVPFINSISQTRHRGQMA
jgi:hypothetical protein